MTYEEFEVKVFRLTNINLALYKEKQMRRRINTLIERLGFDGYDSYLDQLKNDNNSLQFFIGYITINVTEFFRTPDQWQYMADNVLAKLPDDALIWSCACSTGEEPYSLAMSIAERRPLSNIKILATDVDDVVLEQARKGEYKHDVRIMKNVEESTLEKYFTPTINGYRVNDEIRQQVEFRHLNLHSDPFPQNCNLVVCRNILIYFTDEAKNKIYQQFHDCICPGGYLFTGNTEQLIYCKDWGFLKEKPFLYVRK